MDNIFKEILKLIFRFSQSFSEENPCVELRVL